MSEERRYYFISDSHLRRGRDDEESRRSEAALVDFLKEIKPSTEALFLLGDIFDFWFEYRTAVPKGFVRLLGTLSEFTDAGIPVHFFTGNHDIWDFGYLASECGFTLHYHPERFTLLGKDFLIGHGDALGKTDSWFKIVNHIFHSRFCQWLFRTIHPGCGIRWGYAWSASSRKKGEAPKRQKVDPNRHIKTYCLEQLKSLPIDYFIFGHTHRQEKTELTAQATYVNIGEWQSKNEYGIFDSEGFHLKSRGKKC